MGPTLSFPGARFEVDLESYLSQHEIICHQPPRIWQESLVLGNGDLGAAGYLSGHFEWAIGKTEVWDRRFNRADAPLTPHAEIMRLLRDNDLKALEEIKEREGSLYQLPYPTPKPCGYLKLAIGELDIGELISRGGSFQSRLSLYRAEVVTDFQGEGCQGKITSWVDARSDLLVIKLEDECAEQVARTVELCRYLPETALPSGLTPVLSENIERVRQEDQERGQPKFGSDRKTIWLDYTFVDGLRYVMMASAMEGKLRTADGDASATIKLTPTQSSSVIILLAVVTSLESEDPLAQARENIRRAKEVGYEKMLASHRDWWHGFWGQSFISLSDKFIENLWYFQNYVMGSCSRGIQPVVLFSLWNFLDIHPWHGDYHANCNIQMVYWPVFISNHLELAWPYLKHFSRILPQVKEDTRCIYGIDGAKYPFSSATTGEELHGGFWRYEVYVTAWIAEIFWWYYLYSQDEHYLAEVGYPVIKEVAKFYQGFLERDGSGHYCVYPCHAVEHDNQWVRNTTIDLAMARELLTAAVAASSVLGVDNELRAQWQEILDNLSPLPSDGQIFLSYQGADPDFALHHPDPIAPVFPCGRIGVDSPRDLYDCAQRTLQGMLAKTCRPYSRPVEGRKGKRDCFPFDEVPIWQDDLAYSWLSGAAARLGLGETARSYLCDLLILQQLKRNGFFGLVNFTGVLPPTDRGEHLWNLKTTCGFETALNEMLLQSYDGTIRAFPAIPPDWEAKIGNLRAVGAFLVSAEIRRGEVRYLAIESLAGRDCRVANPWPESRVQVRDLSEGKMILREGGRFISFGTAGGHFYLVEKEGGLADSLPLETLKGEQRTEPRAYVGPQYLAKSDQPWTVYLGTPKKDN